MQTMMQQIEMKNYGIKERRANHHNFVMDRDRERKAFQMNHLQKEMEKLKIEELKSFDVDILRKSYFNMVLNSYEIERNVLADQQERMKQQNELEKRYREMDLVFTQNKLKMDEMADRTKLILQANHRGLTNEYLQQRLENVKQTAQLKKDLMLGEAAIKFDFMKEKEEVARLKKRMFEKYQLGKSKNLKKYVKNQKRYLEDDMKIDTDEVTPSNDEGDGETHFTRIAKEADAKMKHMNYSLTEEDTEMSFRQPTLNVKMGLAKPKVNSIHAAKEFYVRLIQARNLPTNVTITKAEIKLINLSNHPVALVYQDFSTGGWVPFILIVSIRSSFQYRHPSQVRRQTSAVLLQA